MKVVMSVLGITMCFLGTTYSGDMSIHDKLRAHWADEKKEFLEYSNDAIKNKIKLHPYVRNNGQLRAVFYGNTGKMTNFFDDGCTYDCSIARLGILLFNESPQKFLRDGKIYNVEGKLLEDHSIENNGNKSSRSYFKMIKRYCTTKLTKRLDT